METTRQLLHNGLVVATGDMLAEQLGASDTQIKQNFSNNKDRYEEGVHYFILKGTELKEFKNQVENFDLVQIDKRSAQLYLWTEKGAFNHVKSLGTDQAWDAFKHLVDTYFKAREIADKVQMTTPAELSRIEILRMAMEAEQEKIRLEQEVKVLSPKAEYTDKVLQSVDTFTTTDIADELGMSAKRLNRILSEKRVQRQHNGRWVLYADYQGHGYTTTRTHEYVSKTDGKIHTDHYMVWTEYGRVFLHNIFNTQLSWSIPRKTQIALRTM